ncbi:MAG: hypothetical protein EBS84_02530 [Proteobacteria bacterium]|nr:hypothetical protein [Verrucomicrobiota bacterium]NBU07887.1 hypothetical protein [Pseudomonadota bacterium]
MNFLIMRRGQKLGPFPDAAAEAMSAAGELKAGDLVCWEGEGDWLPVSRFLELRHQRLQNPEATSGEAVTGGSAATPTKTSFLRRSVEEIDEATLTDAEREVIAGGRFAVYRYCWSLGVSFRHTSAPLLLRAGDDGFGPAFRYSCISLGLGWWGIPGPIWAISTIRHNVLGGKDVTLEELTRLVGHARAAAACARRRPSAAPGMLMRSLGGVMTALALALWLGVGWLGWSVVHNDADEPAPGPGSQEFGAADRQLIQAKRSAIFGNELKAVELANAFNNALKEAYAAAARTHRGTAGFETNSPAISTYCELHLDRVVFLALVPGLQKLPASVRQSLASDAWKASSVALTDQKAGFAGLRVAVGLRSPAKYEHVMTGRYVREFEANNTGLRGNSEGNRSKAKLFPLFVPRDQLESWNDE